MSHSTKTYAFSLDADRFIREGIVTTVNSNEVASTTVTLTSVTTLSVGQSITFLTTAHALQAGPVTIVNVNYTTKVVTLSAAVTVSIGDLVVKYLTATAQMILGVHIVNLNPEAALVTLTSIDGTITHGHFLAAPNSPYVVEREWMAPGGVKIAAVTGVTTPSDTKITIFAKNLG